MGNQGVNVQNISMFYPGLDEVLHGKLFLQSMSQSGPRRDTLAVAVEGDSELLVLQISADRHLSLRGRAAVAGVALPVSLAVDPRGNLWAAGGCAGQRPLSLGCLPHPWTVHSHYCRSQRFT